MKSALLLSVIFRSNDVLSIHGSDLRSPPLRRIKQRDHRSGVFAALDFEVTGTNGR